ncbi:MAG: hypothetical protein ACI8W8_000534 [Rhodothermales bacterium]|jgi:hypothetical protein
MGIAHICWMRIALPFFLLLLSAVAQQPGELEPEDLKSGETLQLSYSNQMRAVVCYGDNTVYVHGSYNVVIILGGCRSVVINGNHNRVRIDGPCESLVLNGNRNGVDVQAAEMVRLSGNLNHCRWRSGLSQPQPKGEGHGKQNLMERYAKKPNAPPWGFYIAPPQRPMPAPAPR